MSPNPAKFPKLTIDSSHIKMNKYVTKPWNNNLIDAFIPIKSSIIIKKTIKPPQINIARPTLSIFKLELFLTKGERYPSS